MKTAKDKNPCAKSSENEVNRTYDLYMDIVNTANILIWRTDAMGNFTFLNPAWEKSYRYRQEDMLGRPFSDFQVPEAAEFYVNAFRNCLIGESVIGHETTFLSKKGDEIHLFINMIPLYDSKGVITGTQGVAYDITERKHADQLLQYISAKDELTGLYNLHTFLSMTEQQIKTTHREKKAILIIYIGVDNMQMINDEYGYDEGDQRLVDIANILRKTFREADIIARVGGDEFVISTSVFSRNTEEMIMKRLQEKLDMYNANKTGSSKLSLSLGSSYNDPEYAVSIDEMLSNAELKMYEHKKSRKR